MMKMTNADTYRSPAEESACGMDGLYDAHDLDRMIAAGEAEGVESVLSSDPQHHAQHPAKHELMLIFSTLSQLCTSRNTTQLPRS